VIIKLEDGLRIAIPKWMLDAAYCALLPEETAPRISLRALAELRDLVDRQSLSAGPAMRR
jgi:hypothetical protein